MINEFAFYIVEKLIIQNHIRFDLRVGGQICKDAFPAIKDSIFCYATNRKPILQKSSHCLVFLIVLLPCAGEHNTGTGRFNDVF